MSAKHTPGPWIPCYTKMDGAICRWHIAGPNYGSLYPICDHVLETDPESGEQLANARLIAAAPELLEALELLISNPYVDLGDLIPLISLISESEGFGKDGPAVNQWNKARQAVYSAIAKAKGETE